MRKFTAATLTACAAVLMALADLIWPRALRGKQVIIPPSAEECARFVRRGER